MIRKINYLNYILFILGLFLFILSCQGQKELKLSSIEKSGIDFPINYAFLDNLSPNCDSSFVFMKNNLQFMGYEVIDNGSIPIIVCHVILPGIRKFENRPYRYSNDINRSMPLEYINISLNCLRASKSSVIYDIFFRNDILDELKDIVDLQNVRIKIRIRNYHGEINVVISEGVYILEYIE